MRSHRPVAATRGLETVLRAVESLPPVRLEVDDARGSAAVRVAARLIARIDLGHGRVHVSAPADRIPFLQRAFPSCRPARDGIVFDVGDAEAAAQAVAAIRRRVKVERLAPQLRASSS